MSEKEVRVYSTPTCSFCRMTKNFLQSNNIKFKEFNVAEDQAAREEMVNKSGAMSVPVIEIDNEIIVGFDQEKIKEKLGI